MLNNNVVKKYERLNTSFKRSLVFHLGVNAGFFSEFNNMLLAMLYCLDKKIRFELFSADANFRIEKGWEDFFLPFCPIVRDDFHSRYNYRWLKIYHPHKKINVWVRKKIKGLDLLTHDVWRLFKNENFAKKHFFIPELGIDGSILEALRVLHSIVWNYNPITEKKVIKIKNSIAIEKPYLAVHLRGGDKYTEHTVYSPEDYAKRIQENANTNVNTKRAFILTDDYRLFLELESFLSDWKLSTTCKKDERGYDHQKFIQQSIDEKAEEHIKLFASMDILAEGEVFIGTYSSNPGMNIPMRMEKHIGLDYANWQIKW